VPSGPFVEFGPGRFRAAVAVRLVAARLECVVPCAAERISQHAQPGDLGRLLECVEDLGFLGDVVGEGGQGALDGGSRDTVF
jgi:hypothetical protein